MVYQGRLAGGGDMPRRRRDKSAMKRKDCAAVALNCAGAALFRAPKKTKKFKPARNIRPARPLSPLLDMLALPFVGLPRTRLRNSTRQE
jgi:hypothetical protein